MRSRSLHRILGLLAFALSTPGLALETPCRPSDVAREGKSDAGISLEAPHLLLAEELGFPTQRRAVELIKRKTAEWLENADSDLLLADLSKMLPHNPLVKTGSSREVLALLYRHGLQLEQNRHLVGHLLADNRWSEVQLFRAFPQVELDLGIWAGLPEDTFVTQPYLAEFYFLPGKTEGGLKVLGRFQNRDKKTDTLEARQHAAVEALGAGRDLKIEALTIYRRQSPETYPRESFLYAADVRRSR